MTAAFGQGILLYCLVLFLHIFADVYESLPHGSDNSFVLFGAQYMADICKRRVF